MSLNPITVFYVTVPGQPVPVRVTLLASDGLWLAEVQHPAISPVMPSIRGMKASGTLATAYTAIAGYFDAVGLSVVQEGRPGETRAQAAGELTAAALAEAARIDARLAAADTLAKQVRTFVKRAQGMWPAGVEFARCMIGFDIDGAQAKQRALALFDEDVKALLPALDALDPKAPAKRK